MPTVGSDGEHGTSLPCSGCRVDRTLVDGPGLNHPGVILTRSPDQNPESQTDFDKNHKSYYVNIGKKPVYLKTYMQEN